MAKAKSSRPKRSKNGSKKSVCDRRDCLLGARFVHPATLELTFADRTFSLAVELLDMPVDRICWETAAASPGGESMTVKAIKGEVIPIDSGTLRYLVDRDYAAGVDASLKSLQVTREERKESARENPPPPEWFAQPERDLRRESWK